MAAYIVVLELGDDSSFAEQRNRLAAPVEAHGGKYLVSGAAAEITEGSLAPQRLAVLEFESVERARALLASAEYTALKELRARSAADVSVSVVEGV